MNIIQPKRLLAIVRSLGQKEELNNILDDLSDQYSVNPDSDLCSDLARAILLIDVAFIDANFDPREFEFIVNTLTNELALSDQETKELIATASSYVQFRGSHAFATSLSKRLPISERKKIAEELKKVVAADEKVDGFEIYLKRKLIDLLSVED